MRRFFTVNTRFYIRAETKEIFNRETNSAAFYAIYVFTTLLPFYATQIINPFLTSRISAKHEKGEEYKTRVDIRAGTRAELTDSNWTDTIIIIFKSILHFNNITLELIHITFQFQYLCDFIPRSQKRMNFKLSKTLGLGKVCKIKSGVWVIDVFLSLT